MKGADRSGARWAVIAGDRDLEVGSVELKDLRSGEQTAVPLSDLTNELLEKLR
jgi:histidyl-tRNA synthetase